MKKYLIISIILLTILSSYLGYQLSIANPKIEITVFDDTHIMIDNKFYNAVEESMTIPNAPIGRYEIGLDEFNVTTENTTIYIYYK